MQQCKHLGPNGMATCSVCLVFKMLTMCVLTLNEIPTLNPLVIDHLLVIVLSCFVKLCIPINKLMKKRNIAPKLIGHLSG